MKPGHDTKARGEVKKKTSNVEGERTRKEEDQIRKRGEGISPLKLSSLNVLRKEERREENGESERTSQEARNVREKKREVKGGQGKRREAVESVGARTVKEFEKGRKSMEQKASNSRGAPQVVARGK